MVSSEANRRVSSNNGCWWWVNLTFFFLFGESLVHLIPILVCLRNEIKVSNITFWPLSLLLIWLQNGAAGTLNGIFRLPFGSNLRFNERMKL